MIISKKTPATPCLSVHKQLQMWCGFDIKIKFCALDYMNLDASSFHKHFQYIY